MKIRCKIEREGGTVVKIGETDYHFLPNAEGAHVAEVTDEAHVQRFLSIPEAYEADYVPISPAVLEQVVSAHAEAPKGGDYNGLTRKQLEKAYFDKFKKKAPARAKDETLVKALIGG